MGTTRKAPTGARHARCVHHEAYATAPKGWLCFSDETAPTDDAILDRMLWADELTAVADAHRAAWAAFQAANPPDGMLYVSDGQRVAPSVPVGWGNTPYQPLPHIIGGRTVAWAREAVAA